MVSTSPIPLPAVVGTETNDGHFSADNGKHGLEEVETSLVVPLPPSLVEGSSLVIGRDCLQVTGIPVVFVSALEGRGRIAVMDQPKIKYFTQVKARPPTFVAFVSGKKQLADSELRFLTRSLKEDFDLGGNPVRVMQRIVVKNNAENGGTNKRTEYTGKTVERQMSSDKRVTFKLEESQVV
ncbi:hypothetical protein AgCh_023187 [Apium graveolens]